MNFDENRNNDYRGYSANGQGAKRPQGHKKIKFKPNKEGMTALLSLFLVAVLVIVLFVLIIKAIANKKPAKTTETTTTVTTETTVDPLTVVPEWRKNYVNKPYASDYVHKGKLILVNNSVEYKFPTAAEESRDIVSLWGQEGYNTNYVLGKI